MTKYGVGVGEDFPVDDRPQAEQEEAGPEGERFRCGGRGFRGRHDAWHQFRDQMRAEWRARRRAFRDSMNQREGVEAMDEHHRHAHKIVIGGLALIGLAALLNLFTNRR